MLYRSWVVVAVCLVTLALGLGGTASEPVPLAGSRVNAGEPMMLNKETPPQNSGAGVQPAAHAVALTDPEWAYLQSFGWKQRLGSGIGVWVSVDEQVFRVVQGRTVLLRTVCATAARGTGSEMDSLKTPLGWHRVSQKLGDGAPVGRVFRSRQATKDIWKPGDEVKEDLVLTRVLLLDGLEPGKNQGGTVDSFARNIYIHGTNAEDLIGKPSSHGCIRLTNRDVIAAFDLIPQGTPLLITERAAASSR